MSNPHDDDFRLFPYRANTADGRTNNGGIDLVQEPHRIAEITEASTFPELRALLVEANGEGSPYITLGCDAGPEDQRFQGYIEFSVRPQYADHSSVLLNLDSAFTTFVKQYGDSEVDWNEYCAQTLRWESAIFSFKATPDVDQHKVTVWYQFNNQQEAATFVTTLTAFLLDHVAIPTQNTRL